MHWKYRGLYQILLAICATLLTLSWIELISSHYYLFQKGLIHLALLGGGIGATLGLCFGSMAGLVEKDLRVYLSGALLGLLIGLFFGVLSYLIGQLSESLFYPQTKHLTTHQVSLLIHTCSWSVLGLSNGLILYLSQRRRFKLFITPILYSTCIGLFTGLLFYFLKDHHTELITRVISFLVFSISLSLFYVFSEKTHIASFRILNGEKKGRFAYMKKGFFILGKDKSSHLRLSKGYAGIRHKHVHIECPGNDFYFKTHAEGILLNGERKTKGHLLHGDFLEVGNAKLLFEYSY